MESSAKIKAVDEGREYNANTFYNNSVSSKVSPLPSRNDNIAEKELNEEDIDDLSFLHELVSNLVNEKNNGNDENDENDENKNQCTSTDNFTNAVEGQSYMEISDDANDESSDDTDNESNNDTDNESSNSVVSNELTDEDFEDKQTSDTSGNIIHAL
jgi:hypothetical protein